MPINEPAYKRPDPLIYSQGHLMKLGLAVTWDNPDIELFLGGAPVPSSALEPGTEYEVVARIWNGSTEAPVVGLPVRFSYLSFGIGTQSHPIGDATVNLGVIGGPDHPAFAKMKWRTPDAPGHYCLQVAADWLDDLNPDNNLGQENTDVGVLSSPANFSFALRNGTHERLEYRFELDAYRLPAPPDCAEGRTAADRRESALARHDRQKHPVPAGWSVAITPEAPVLSPGEEIAVGVEVTAPDDFQGTKAINVNAFTRYGLAGGVTLYVEAS